MEETYGKTLFDNPDSNTKCLKIKLTPLEPYFFGTDRTFSYDPDKGSARKGSRRSASYFMRSAEAPSQTTLFGALRFLGIENPDKGFRLSDDDEAHIGCGSFALNNPEANKSGFGMIHCISPLYLTDAADNLHARIPFDHKAGPKKEDLLTEYTPYCPGDYESVPTSDGEKLLPRGYSAKEATPHQWFNISTGKICKNKNLFEDVEQVGNAKNKHEDGFFKKVFKQIQEHGFVFFALVEKSFKVYSDKIFLGHGNSLFSVEWVECKPECEKDDSYQQIKEGIVSRLQSDIIYAQSDFYLPDCAAKNLFGLCSFVATQTKTMRVFTTDYDKSSHKQRFHVGSELLHLFSAGSVFKLKNSGETQNYEKAFWNILESPASKHVQIAGFNHLMKGN